MHYYYYYYIIIIIIIIIIITIAKPPFTKPPCVNSRGLPPGLMCVQTVVMNVNKQIKSTFIHLY